MSTTILNEPLVDLSTCSAFFWEGPSEPPANVEEWQLVRVILAQITPQTYGLTVCPVLDCGLAPHPITPSVEMLIPESSSGLIFDGIAKRATIVRLGAEPKFYLYFDEMLEFWNFAALVAQLRSNEEERKADVMEKLKLVRLFVPAHGPDGLMDILCHNAEHLDGKRISASLSSTELTTLREKDEALSASPSSSSTVTLT